MADTEIKFDDAAAKKFFKDLLKSTNDVKSGQSEYLDAISSLVFKDIIRHFEKEEGPEGAWKEWSQVYRSHMQKIGKGGNQILQDTGRLRQSIAPGNRRKTSKGIEWFTNVKSESGQPYAANHDNGTERLPQRSFMWLSDSALETINKVTRAYILRG